MSQRPPRKGILCPRWSEEEQKVMRERYHLDGALVLAERFGRSAGSIRTKACAMGLCSQGRPAQRIKPAAAPMPVVVAAPEPVIAAPVLSTTSQGKKKKDAQPSAIAKMLEQMRALPAGHPRRMAYMLAARNGNGQDAYEAWLNWKPQPQAA